MRRELPRPRWDEVFQVLQVKEIDSLGGSVLHRSRRLGRRSPLECAEVKHRPWHPFPPGSGISDVSFVYA